MLISFLLPTRNRLDYLKLAIETVRREEDPQWEIVVSDNASSEDVAGYVSGLRDERIIYHRTSGFLPVTENWNEALALSSGDYVLMLGDDDGLLPGYLPRMRALIDRFERPELIYTGSLIFTYPGVDAESPDGFVERNVHAEFFKDASGPFLLRHEQAVAAVRHVMEFRLAFNFNMQHSLVSHDLIELAKRRGDFFQSSFPDYYATCAAFLTAHRIVADPNPRVVIGVTPKSYGFFHLNRREEAGREFLGGQRERELPGTNINDGWLSAVEALEARYGAAYGLRVNRRRYRFLQATHVYAARRRGLVGDSDVAKLEESLPARERFVYHAADAVARKVIRVVPRSLWERLMRIGQGQFPALNQQRERARFSSMLDLYEHHARDRPEPIAG